LVIFRRRVAGLTEAALSNFVNKARRIAGVTGQVNVLIAENRELRLLNSKFRGKDKPTDVLSFPSETDLAKPGLTKLCAGEIAISADIASANARLLGHNIREEIKILALHGILHLAGYDHEQDKGEMAREELRLRSTLNLPTGLIERSQLPGATGKGLRKARGPRTKSKIAGTSSRLPR
jgi:probable rRNA maturation factor